MGGNITIVVIGCGWSGVHYVDGVDIGVEWIWMSIQYPHEAVLLSNLVVFRPHIMLSLLRLHPLQSTGITQS